MRNDWRHRQPVLWDVEVLTAPWSGIMGCWSIDSTVIRYYGMLKYWQHRDPVLWDVEVFTAPEADIMGCWSTDSTGSRYYGMLKYWRHRNPVWWDVEVLIAPESGIMGCWSIDSTGIRYYGMLKYWQHWNPVLWDVEVLTALEAGIMGCWIFFTGVFRNGRAHYFLPKSKLRMSLTGARGLVGLNYHHAHTRGLKVFMREYWVDVLEYKPIVVSSMPPAGMVRFWSMRSFICLNLP